MKPKFEKDFFGREKALHLAWLRITLCMKLSVLGAGIVHSSSSREKIPIALSSSIANRNAKRSIFTNILLLQTFKYFGQSLKLPRIASLPGN